MKNPVSARKKAIMTRPISSKGFRPILSTKNVEIRVTITLLLLIAFDTIIPYWISSGSFSF